MLCAGHATVRGGPLSDLGEHPLWWSANGVRQRGEKESCAQVWHVEQAVVTILPFLLELVVELFGEIAGLVAATQP